MSKKRDRGIFGEVLGPVETPMQFEPITSPEPVKIPEPVKTDPSALMALRVFGTIAGPKWDQMAGFVSWATRLKLGPMTMQQWQTEYEKFKTRPVG